MDVDQIRVARIKLIEQFLADNAATLGVADVDGVGEGPFMLTDWCLTIHLRDMSVDDYSIEPNEVRAAFFRPGMSYSQRLGLLAALDEGVRFPRQCDGDADE